MGVTYRNADYVFDKEAWAKLLETMTLEIGQAALAELLEVSEGAVWSWRNQRYVKGFEYPNMTNFLKVVNLAGHPPVIYFVLENWE